MKKRKTCIYCGRSFCYNGSEKKMCSRCESKRESVHELYLACQSLKKRLGMPYDKILDIEVEEIVKGD